VLGYTIQFMQLAHIFDICSMKNWKWC